MDNPSAIYALAELEEINLHPKFDFNKANETAVGHAVEQYALFLLCFTEANEEVLMKALDDKLSDIVDSAYKRAVKRKEAADAKPENPADYAIVSNFARLDLIELCSPKTKNGKYTDGGEVDEIMQRYAELGLDNVQ